MNMRWMGLVAVVSCLSGCGQMGQTSDPDVGHGKLLAKEEKTFMWGPAAPEAPIVPSPVPQMPEQPNSPMSPGDGPKSTDKVVPSTSMPETPK